MEVILLVCETRYFTLKKEQVLQVPYGNGSTKKIIRR